MAKYLVQVSYSAEGTKGLLKEGGSQRRATVEEMMKGLGVKVEAFYYCMGDYDAMLIMDAPDNTTMAAVAMAVNAAGAATTKTTALLTVEEVDAATKKTVNYRPPGR